MRSKTLMVRSAARPRVSNHEAAPPPSRDGNPPELYESNVPPKIRGRRECRVHDAPAASRATKKRTSVVATGTPKQPDIPCAMVLRLLRALPGDRALLPPSLRGNDSCV